MTSLEQGGTRSPEDKPFQHLAESERHEEAAAALSNLGLSFDSTVARVRSVAVTLRLQAQNKGIDAFTLRDLGWALKEVGDCKTGDELIDFLSRRQF